MRKLMWFTVGFTAACALGIYLLGILWSIVVAAICLITAVCVLIFPKTRSRILSAVLCGCVLGFAWFSGYSWIYLSPAKEYDGQELKTQLTVTDYSVPTDYGIQFDGTVSLDGKDYSIRCYRYSSDALQPGDIVSGTVRLKYTVDDDFGHHPGKGIFLIGYIQDNAVVTSSESSHIRYFPAHLRKSITDMIDAVFTADTLAFARALLLGDSSLLTYEDNTNFSLSGIRHVIAVSGLHVSILFSMIMFFP